MTTTAVLEARQGREGSKTMKEDEEQNFSSVSDESPRPAQASELIAHLESGGFVATGDPDHVLFLRYEIYDWNGTLQKHLGAYGWGSALGTPEGKLKRLLDEPFKWVMVSNDYKGGRNEQEAKAALEKLGHYVDYEWEWLASDTRRPNIDMRPASALSGDSVAAKQE